MNTALKVLLEHREEERSKLEGNIIANINRLEYNHENIIGESELCNPASPERPSGRHTAVC